MPGFKKMKEPNYSSHALLTPANGLTFLRMVFTPIMLVMIRNDRTGWPTLTLWIVLCMSDLVDGKLARMYGVSKSGAFLDPLADKFLVLGAMVMLVVAHQFWWLPVALIAFREVAMSVYRSAVAKGGTSIPASKPAKYKTLTQQLAVGFALAPWIGIHATWTAQILLWVSVALTLATGAQYLRAARQ